MGVKYSAVKRFPQSDFPTVNNNCTCRLHGAAVVSENRASRRVGVKRLYKSPDYQRKNTLMFSFHWQPVPEPLLRFHLVTGFCQMIGRMMFKMSETSAVLRVLSLTLVLAPSGHNIISQALLKPRRRACARALSACIRQSEGSGCQQQLC